MTDTTWKTARGRKQLSSPMAYLKESGALRGVMLDYGCGRGDDIRLLKEVEGLEADGYDPHFKPGLRPRQGGYDVITCMYVLNVLEDEEERLHVENRIMTHLKPGGVAFIAVRNDKRNLKGRTSTGTWQGDVTPSEDWTLVRTTTQFRLYSRTKEIA